MPAEGKKARSVEDICSKVVLLFVILFLGGFALYRVSTLIDAMPQGFYRITNSDIGGKTPIGEITDGMTVTQVLPCSDDTAGISVMFATYARPNNSGDVTVTVTGFDSGKTYVDEDLTVAEFADNEFKDFPFAMPLESEGAVIVSITSTSPPSKALTIWKTEIDSIPGYAFYIDDVEQPGDLVCRTFEEGNSLSRYIGLLLALVVIGFVCILVFSLRKSVSMETKYLVSALLLGSLYMFAMTPFSIPDESHHYQSAYELSNLLRFHWNQREYGNSADFDYSDFKYHFNTGSAYGRISREFSDEAVEGELMRIPRPRSIAYPLEYVPQALGISVAKLFHANFILSFFLGRFCNLLFFVLCGYLAVKTTPRFKLLFCIMGLLPMTLHQAASYSYDGFIDGMSLLLIGLIVRAIYTDGLFKVREALTIAVVGALLAPAKLVYWPILFLLVLVPKTRFQSGKKKALYLCTIWAVAAAFLLLFQLSNVASVVTPSPAGNSVNWEGESNYTRWFILHYPIQTSKIFIDSLFYNTPGWLEYSIGACLSGMSLQVESVTVYGFILLALISSLNTVDGQDRIRAVDRLCFLLVFFMILLLIMLSMFLGWTSDTRKIIQGVQGRYLLPILPLLFLSCNNTAFAILKSVNGWVLLAAAYLNIDVILQVLNFTVVH